MADPPACCLPAAFLLAPLPAVAAAAIDAASRAATSLLLALQPLLQQVDAPLRVLHLRGIIIKTLYCPKPGSSLQSRFWRSVQSLTSNPTTSGVN